MSGLRSNMAQTVIQRCRRRWQPVKLVGTVSSIRSFVALALLMVTTRGHNSWSQLVGSGVVAAGSYVGCQK